MHLVTGQGIKHFMVKDTIKLAETLYKSTDLQLGKTTSKPQLTSKLMPQTVRHDEDDNEDDDDDDDEQQGGNYSKKYDSFTTSKLSNTSKFSDKRKLSNTSKLPRLPEIPYINNLHKKF
jgi:hypothetical protein